jgi:hypothetical protein
VILLAWPSRYPGIQLIIHPYDPADGFFHTVFAVIHPHLVYPHLAHIDTFDGPSSGIPLTTSHPTFRPLLRLRLSPKFLPLDLQYLLRIKVLPQPSHEHEGLRICTFLAAQRTMQVWVEADGSGSEGVDEVGMTSEIFVYVHEGPLADQDIGHTFPDEWHRALRDDYVNRYKRFEMDTYA